MVDASFTENEVGYCIDCRSCELVCSFHHSESFCPAVASVSICRDFSTGVVVRRVYREDRDGHLACDGCQGEPERLCEKVCSVDAVRRLFEARQTGA